MNNYVSVLKLSICQNQFLKKANLFKKSISEIEYFSTDHVFVLLYYCDNFQLIDSFAKKKNLFQKLSILSCICTIILCIYEVGQISKMIVYSAAFKYLSI